MTGRFLYIGGCMGHEMDNLATDGERRLRTDFMRGLHCFHHDDYAAALVLFRAADARADLGDIFRGRYTSFYGLSRVCTGDRGGVKLCRKVAAGETRDVEVFYSLAMAEYRLDNREGAHIAVYRGLRIDPAHSGLRCLEQELLHGRRVSADGSARHNLLRRLLDRMLGGALKSSR